MAAGLIAPRKAEAEAMRHGRELRRMVEERMKAKDISAAEALRELTEEALLSDMIRAQRLSMQKAEGERKASLGWGRGAFARAIDAEMQTLLSANPHMNSRAAFLKATAEAIRKEPGRLTDWRKDCLPL